MYKIGIFGSKYKDDELLGLKECFQALEREDVVLYFEHESYTALQTRIKALTFEQRILPSEGELELDFAISLGGDGNFLRTTKRIGRQDIPILGINLGHLGFLTDLDLEESAPEIPKLFSQEFKIEERKKLSISVDNQFLGEALNDIAILKRETGSMINVHTLLNGEYLADYEADGLILSTPSGSTAYSLSVYGPIITPNSPCLLLAPIAPHSLNIRPLVVSDTTQIELSVEAKNDSYLLVIDGESHTLRCGSQIKVKLSEHLVKMVRLKNRPFVETLQRKLYWAKPVRE